MAATGHVISAILESSPTGQFIYAFFRSGPLGFTTIDDNQPWLHAYSLTKAKTYVRRLFQRVSSCFIWLGTAKQDSSYNDQVYIAHRQTSLPLTLFFHFLFGWRGFWIAMLAFPLGALSGIGRVSSVVFVEKRQESSGTAVILLKGSRVDGRRS